MSGGFNSLPEKLREALERCDLLIDKEQLDYFYDLYDPKTGGFYYSISSRDSEEMTPFAEGTSFVLTALRHGGMTLPDWYKEKVGNWILNHQDESDGFFYEDLWGKITSGPRIYRDLVYSQSILSLCGLKAKYAYPEERIKSGTATSEQSAGFPEYLSSKEKMKEYLDSLNWKETWGTGQKLVTAMSMMQAAGLYEYVYDYVVDKQNKETGLWGEGLDWMNTNGAMKLSGFFCDEDHPYPNPKTAIESVKRIYGGVTPPTYATYIWNPFVLLSGILYSNKKRADELRGLLWDSGADIVNRAVDCALLLRRKDGGFASCLNEGAPRQQAYLFGHGFKDESDLDGTVIAGYRLRSYIWTVFGLEAPEDYYTHLNDEFWERCRSKPEIVKTLPRPEGSLNPWYLPENEKIYKPKW